MRPMAHSMGDRPSNSASSLVSHCASTSFFSPFTRSFPLLFSSPVFNCCAPPYLHCHELPTIPRISPFSSQHLVGEPNLYIFPPPSPPPDPHLQNRKYIPCNNQPHLFLTLCECSLDCGSFIAARGFGNDGGYGSCYWLV